MLIKAGPFVLATRKEWHWFQKAKTGEVLTVTVECEDKASAKIKEITGRLEELRALQESVNG